MRGSPRDNQEHKDPIQECKEKIRKAKTHLILHLARDMKDNKKGFCKYINNKRQMRENVEPLMNGAENMVTKDRENAEMFKGTFTLDLSGNICLSHSQVPETYGKVWKKHDLPLVRVN